ncbi:unnamed protein product, partial [Allacma fusca]
VEVLQEHHTPMVWVLALGLKVGHIAQALVEGVIHISQALVEGLIHIPQALVEVVIHTRSYLEYIWYI